MTKFEKAVKYIGEEFKKAGEDLDCKTCGEAIKVWGLDAKDLKEEFRAILNDTELWQNYTDDGEFFDDDRDYTFRQLSSSVRRYKF